MFSTPNYPFFIARRLYRDDASGKKISRPAVLIAGVGIAIGLVVMIIAVAVVVGFKREIRNKIIGFGSHIQITNIEAVRSYETPPVIADDSIMNAVSGYSGVKHVQRYSTKPGMIKTDDAFQGMVLKGVGEEYDTSFFEKHLIEGQLPLLSDSASSNQILISKTLASKLKISTGDNIYTYYIQDNVRARRMTVTGIYQTDFAEYDNLFMLTDIYTVNRLNNWAPEQASGMEIEVENYDKLEETTYLLSTELFEHTDRYGAAYCVLNIEQLNPSMFAWLDVLNVNVWVILILMIGVAGFTMISGLLILIIERTNMIGLLKAFGADNSAIRRIFLWLSFLLIGRGMIWGNVIGLLLCFLQSRFKLITLDPVSYYVDSIPVAFDIRLFLLLNIGTLFASLLMLVGPSYIITRINPAVSMRYE